MYSFGINTSLSSIISTIFDNIYSLILGKYFSINQVGYYYQAKKIQIIQGNLVKMVANNTVFSVLAKFQDDVPEFFRVYNKIVSFFVVLLGLISTLIYLYSDQLILALFGTKWIVSSFYLQLLTLSAFFIYIQLINRSIYKIFNFTRELLYLEFFQKVIQIFGILIGLYFLDLKIILVSLVLSNAIGYFFSAFYVRKKIVYKNFFEVRIIVYVSVLSALIIALYKTFLVNICVNLYMQLAFLPLIILVYFIALKKTNSFHLIDEIKAIAVHFRK
jgi:O-antigen/teichoic acid export membrane protein